MRVQAFAEEVKLLLCYLSPAPERKVHLLILSDPGQTKAWLCFTPDAW